MKHLLLVFTFLASFNALAEWGEAGRFRTATLQVVDKALQSGMTEVQGIRLSDLKSFVEKAPIYYDKHISAVFGNRRCAMWQPGGGNANPIILLNKQCTDLTDEELGALGLHENLGLAYGADRNYEISTEILAGKVGGRKMILDKLQVPEMKSFNLDKALSSGGSTGVGGGGDSDDLHFKLEGLKVLKESTDGFFDGIPVELLAMALRKMRVKPASNITGLIEFRGPGVEEENTVVYISSVLYRSREVANVGRVACMAARLYVLHSSEEMGLPLQQLSEQGKTFVAAALAQAILMMPSADGKGVVTWVNPALKDGMSRGEFESLAQSERARVQAIVGNPEYQKLFQMYANSTVVRLTQ